MDTILTATAPGSRWDHRTVTIREQIIAIEICRRHSKAQIADAYLSIAFFGSGQIGVEQLESDYSLNLEQIEPVHAIALVAQLKYPKPLKPFGDWQQKIQMRSWHLQRLRQQLMKSLDHAPQARPHCR
ncbi:MAG: hypothetical protein CL581_13510 [Alteromonadaceae bacterium]|nr:hypothetical protein [Alteromonadaceae bacterium]MBH84022.1 hypothetical protein [Alteromonadaceae bacterium]